MPDNVPRLLLAYPRRFHDVALGRVLRFDDGQFRGGVVAEHILEDGIEAGGVFNDAIRGPSFVEDRHGRAVQFRVLQGVLVDEVAKDFVRFFLFAAQDGRACTADDGGIRQSLAQVAMQRARVGTVRFIHQHQDFLRVVELWEHLETDVFRERHYFLDDLFVFAWFLFFAGNGHRNFVGWFRAWLWQHFHFLAFRLAAYHLILLQHGHDDVGRSFTRAAGSSQLVIRAISDPDLSGEPTPRSTARSRQAVPANPSSRSRRQP